MSKIVKMALLVLGLSIIIFLGVRIIFPLILNIFFGKDVASVDDSSLKLSTVTLSQTDNSFFDLENAAAVIDLKNIPEGKTLAKDYISSGTWADDKVVALLSDNKLALQYFRDAASKQKFQSPNTADPNNVGSNLVGMNSWRQVSQIACVQAIWLAKNGYSDEAMETALSVLFVGDAIERSQADFITYLVGVSLKRSAYDTFLKIIPDLKLDPDTFLEYKQKLDNYSLSDNSSPWKFEYILRKNSILEMADGRYDVTETAVPKNIKIKEGYYFKPNKSISELHAYYAQLIIDAKNPCLQNKPRVSAAQAVSGPTFAWYFTENAVNKILLSTSDVAYQGFLDNKCRIEEKYLELISLLNQ